MRPTGAAVNEPAEAVSALTENVAQLKTPTSDVARADVLTALRGLIDGDIEAGWPIVERYLIPAGIALLFLLVAYLFAGMISRICSRPIRRKVDETLGRFIGKIIFYSIFALAAIGVLGQFGVSVASFAALLAAAGFAIGLAFQGTLSNFASGVLLMVFRPFKVGDYIKAAGVAGKVYEIDMFTTVLDTSDNRRIIVPNNSITASTIENVSYNTCRRIEVSVDVDYAASLDQTREVLTAVAESMREFLVDDEGRGYKVTLMNLGDSAVQWVIRFWVAASDYSQVREGLTAAVKNHLDDAGISIPYPQ
ncbi:MAG: mechanosensitive ion channel domain-containing protein, partial [Pirellulaceae bacterium]